MVNIGRKTPKLSSNLRKDVARLYRQYEVLLILTNLIDEQELAKVESEKSAIEKISRPKLLEVRKRLRSEIDKLRAWCGAKAHPRVYEKFVSKFQLELKEAQRKNFGLLPKYVIDDLFSHYDAVIRDFDKLPLHARIGIDVLGVRSDKRAGVEIYILETMLYENMCALLNLTAGQDKLAQVPNSSKRTCKEAAALKRACATMAFYFVEAYLNGIGFDYYVEHEKDLPEAEIKFLTEWDRDRQRPFLVGLRDKLLHYPRIIMGKDHPPLQEDNCSELKFFLETAKLIRDSIVHASPKLDPTSFEPVKERLFMNLHLDDCCKIVDTTIALVRKIETTIAGSDSRLPWLKNRGTDGLFEDSVFS